MTGRQRVRVDLEDTQHDDTDDNEAQGKRKPGWQKAGPGRPPGAMNKLAKAAQQYARATGEMPHEFLLRVARGELITVQILDQESGEIKKAHQIADLGQRMEAAKAAAPYYAPKLTAVEFSTNLSDGELRELIQQYASAAGLGPTVNGAGPAPEAEDGGGTPSTWL